MKASKRARKALDVTLDAGVWGKLQDRIPLRNVYEKLPHQDLFRLRLVCKEWNHAALQRLEPKPYFVIIHMGDDEQFLNGILSYDVASGNFSYKRQQYFPLCGYQFGNIHPLEVEGLIFCNHPDQKTFKGQQGVFNVHTKTWHAISPAPLNSNSVSNHSRFPKLAYGMIVDTSARPYSFKLVVGSCDRKTQIYDSKSRSWKTLTSQLMPLAGPAFDDCQYLTCICSNGLLYISLGVKLLLMYSIEGDIWSALDFPQVDEERHSCCPIEDIESTHALGVWEGRIFTSRDDQAELKVRVWELVDQKWVDYAGTSKEEYEWLLDCSASHNNSPDPTLVPSFCNGDLLVYNWQYSVGRAEKLMMLNLATKKWKHVDLSRWKVAIDIDSDEEECDFDEEDYSEEEDDEEDF